MLWTMSTYQLTCCKYLKWMKFNTKYRQGLNALSDIEREISLKKGLRSRHLFQLAKANLSLTHANRMQINHLSKSQMLLKINLIHIESNQHLIERKKVWLLMRRWELRRSIASKKQKKQLKRHFLCKRRKLIKRGWSLYRNKTSNWDSLLRNGKRMLSLWHKSSCNKARGNLKFRSTSSRSRRSCGGLKLPSASRKWVKIVSITTRNSGSYQRIRDLSWKASLCSKRWMRGKRGKRTKRQSLFSKK